MKLRKRITAILCAFTMSAALFTGVNAASLSGSGKISDYNTAYYSLIESKSAEAKTTLGLQYGGVVTVSGDYYYVNYVTMETGSETKTYGHYNSATVYFNAPENSTSVKLVSNHTASYNEQSWSANGVTNVYS